MIIRNQLASDLLPFIDIGAEPPKITEKPGEISAKFMRDGREFKLTVDQENGRVVITKKGFPQRSFASISSMLASEDFSNLKKWADSQAELLRKTAVDRKKLLPINANTHKSIRISSIAQVDGLLNAEERKDNAAEILLIDGPAGIGKTNLIDQLALHRAENYRSSPTSLILHVRSRGRVLSNLQDLMAFSLQTLRSNTTYDQVPVLLRHGLITVAVDGFDELGDPNGYDLAWSQVNDLIASARGKGTILLSGRDTFLGRDRLFRDVQSLRDGYDVVTGLTLDSPTPSQAIDWLKTKGWADVHFHIPAISSLLEEGSFALRPVFLSLMADNVEPKRLREQSDNFLTPLLVQHLLEREAGLFGDAVEGILTKEGIENFLLRFLIETARDMADAQSEAVDETTLSWLVDLSLNANVPDEIKRLIQNRAGVVAALKPDVRQGYKSFIHSHLQNYFLSLATLEAVGKGEVPKFLKRNVLGSEMVAVFSDVAAKASATQAPQISDFLHRATPLASIYGGLDRAGRNVGALMIASLPLVPDGLELTDCEIDETVVQGTANSAKLTRVSIHQLDCRAADLRTVEFSDCRVISLIANEATRFSPTFPLPRHITLEGGQEIIQSDLIEKWLTRHGRNDTATVVTGLALPALANHGIYKLLGRACRVRQYWLRLGDDVQADKILRDQYWQDLADRLRQCNLLREESRQASGSSSTFTHIRMREKILAEDAGDPDVLRLFQTLNEHVSPEACRVRAADPLF